uniref:Eukaryotic translation elongation factor 1 epsilon 1 n=1 Tax=Oryzias latipes TaxID=8090 RepID=A0A3P9K3G7_ORYLA
MNWENMALRELSSLEKYLGLKKPNKYSTQGDKKVPVLQNNQGPPLVGLITIACHLVKEAKRSNLLGESAEARAVVQQWLEYRVTRLDGCTKEDSKTILKVLKYIRRTPTFQEQQPSNRFFSIQVDAPNLRSPPHWPKFHSQLTTALCNVAETLLIKFHSQLIQVWYYI